MATRCYTASYATEIYRRSSLFPCSPTRSRRRCTCEEKGGTKVLRHEIGRSFGRGSSFQTRTGPCGGQRSSKWCSFSEDGSGNAGGASHRRRLICYIPWNRLYIGELSIGSTVIRIK